MAVATIRLFSAPDSSGARRLVASPGDVAPTGVALFNEAGEQVTGPGFAVGVVSGPDPITTAILPLEGYDALNEAQVLALLPQMSADELIALQDYERAHMARGSITRWGKTSRVVRGARDESAPMTVPSRSLTEGYGAMSPAELQALIVERGIVTKATSPEGLVKALQKFDAEQADSV